MILKTLVFVLFDLLNKRYNMMPDSFLKWKVKTLKKRDIKTNRIFSLIGFHKVWFSWHLNEPCTWGNKPVCLAAPGAGSRNTCRSECVSVYVCMGNTEVTVVFMPAVRMLSLPTTLFHSPPLCFCLLVYVCQHIILHSEVPAASASLVTGRTDPVWQRQRGLLVRWCKSTGNKFFIWTWFTQISSL